MSQSALSGWLKCPSVGWILADSSLYLHNSSTYKDCNFPLPHPIVPHTSFPICQCLHYALVPPAHRNQLWFLPQEKNRNLLHQSITEFRSPHFHTSHPSDPLVHYGSHFGRTVHTMCNINMLLTCGFHWMHQKEEDTSAAVKELTTQYVSPLSIQWNFSFLLFLAGPGRSTLLFSSY